MNIAKLRECKLLQCELTLKTNSSWFELEKKITDLHGNYLISNLLGKYEFFKYFRDYAAVKLSVIRNACLFISSLEEAYGLTFDEVRAALKRKHWNTPLGKIFTPSDDITWDLATKYEVINLLDEFDFWICIIEEVIGDQAGPESIIDCTSAASLYDSLNKPLVLSLSNLQQLGEVLSNSWELDSKVLDEVIKNLKSLDKNYDVKFLTDCHSFNHYNPFTRREYQSFYSWMLLTIASMTYGFKSNLWATKKQWKRRGYKVKDNANFGIVYHHFKVNEKDYLNKIDETKNSFGQKLSIVYNSDDIVEFTPVDIQEKMKLEDIEALVNNTQANISEGHEFSPMYLRDKDLILMPSKVLFSKNRDYFAVLFHELIHWTGHESRCKRKFGKFGDDAYAFEELVAELGSSFISSRLSLVKSVRKESISYICSWLGNFSEEEFIKILEQAALHANKASNYIFHQTKAD